jgi:hypothetical protein
MIDRTVIKDFLKFGVPLTLVAVIVAKYVDHHTASLTKMILTGLTVSFLYSAYRVKYIPWNRIRKTRKELKKMEEHGFSFNGTDYEIEHGNGIFSVGYFRNLHTGLPNLLIKLELQGNGIENLKIPSYLTESNSYIEEEKLCSIYEILNMQTMIKEALAHVEVLKQNIE